MVFTTDEVNEKAIAATSIITTRKGALKVMPSKAEVKALINK